MQGRRLFLLRLTSLCDASANTNALLNLYPALLPSCVSLRPINLPRRQSSTRPFYEYTVQPLSFVSFTFLPSALKPVSLVPEESIRVWGPRKSPAVGNCRFYDALEGFPPGDGLQRRQSFLKRAKLKLHPPPCVMPFFLTRP